MKNAAALEKARIEFRPTEASHRLGEKKVRAGTSRRKREHLRNFWLPERKAQHAGSLGLGLLEIRIRPSCANDQPVPREQIAGIVAGRYVVRCDGD